MQRFCIKMKKLYQNITKSFLGTFVLTFFIVVFIWVMQFVWLYIDDLVGKGLELKIIAELLFYTSITAIPMSLPLALLLALLMCFGNLIRILDAICDGFSFLPIIE